jgi:ABC-type branched-subunit amino acid transport system substrate-binding protein
LNERVTFYAWGFKINSNLSAGYYLSENFIRRALRWPVTACNVWTICRSGIFTALAAFLLFFFSAAALAGQKGDIVLGMSGAFSGATRSLGIELYRGANAYFSKINEQGGIHGRKIRILAYDDGYNPGPAVQNTIKLIREDNVFCLFNYVGTPTTTRILPLLAKFSSRDIYLFCPFTGANPMRQPPYAEYVYNLRASYDQEIKALVDNFVRIGRKRIAVLHQVDAYGRGGWQGVKKALDEHDLNIVAEATYKRGAPFEKDFTPQVDILEAGDPDAIICIASYAAAAGFIRDARKENLDVPIANISFVDSRRMLSLLRRAEKEDNADYTFNLVNSQVVPFYGSKKLPVVEEYKHCMLEYKPGLPEKFHCPDYDMQGFGAVSFEGFLNAKLVTALLRKMGPDPARGKIPRNMIRLLNVDLGLDENIDFTPFKHQGLDKVYFITFEEDRILPLRDFREVVR